MRRPSSRRILVTLTVATLIGSLLVVCITDSALGAASASSATAWTVYHGDAAGSGVATTLASVNTSKRAWTSASLDGQLFGEPLVYAGLVYVATQSDMVYALSSVNGRVVWSRHVGSAVPSSKLPCGNISPSVGITGTPVIDPSRNEIFVVADVLVNGSPRHYLIGLSTNSGALLLKERADPPGSDPAALLQRSGLTLDAGHVIFAFGGNYGDCGSYRGRVMSLRESGSRPTIFTVDAVSGDSQGAVWMGGAAPVVDAKGNIWVSVGNGSVQSSGQAYDDSDSVLELSATLRLKQFFAPATWAQDNASDHDMSTAPALLPDGHVVIAGKSPTVYLLSGSRLGGIGGEAASLVSNCGNDTDGGSAVLGMTVYLPCLNGPIALRVASSPPGLRILWQSSVGGGPPIVAAHLIWTIGQNGVLYGLNASTGHVRQQATIGVPANHFPTPSVGEGLLLAASATRVVAFRANAVP